MDAARVEKGRAPSAEVRGARPLGSRAIEATRRRSALGLLSLAVACGCAKESAKDEARLRRDEVQLGAIVEADRSAERALADVGEAEKKNEEDEAARRIEANVVPAAERAMALARDADVTTAWGRARRDEMLVAMTDRLDELRTYARALRAHDLDLELASAQKQLAIERRAMLAARAILDGPDAGSR